MISKFLIVFFTIFAHSLSGIIITNHNSNCEFDVRSVERIGLVEVDSSFIDYVLDKNFFSWFCQRSIFSGKDLQKQLLDYVKVSINKVNVFELNSEDIKYINSLIYSQEIDKPEEIMSINDIIGFFHPITFH